MLIRRLTSLLVASAIFVIAAFTIRTLRLPTPGHFADAYDETLDDPRLTRHVDAIDLSTLTWREAIARLSTHIGMPIDVDWPRLESAGIDPDATYDVKLPAGRVVEIVDAFTRLPFDTDPFVGSVFNDGRWRFVSTVSEEHFVARVYPIEALLNALAAEPDAFDFSGAEENVHWPGKAAAADDEIDFVLKLGQDVARHVTDTPSSLQIYQGYLTYVEAPMRQREFSERADRLWELLQNKARARRAAGG